MKTSCMMSCDVVCLLENLKFMPATQFREGGESTCFENGRTSILLLLLLLILDASSYYYFRC